MSAVEKHGIDLFPYNAQAYQAASEMLLDTGKAAVIHPTGTGKSFIGFKLAEDNPDKVVCWLSPSEYIFKTQIENLKAAGADEPENIKFFTYAKLMNMGEDELAEIEPDIVILDEFHRGGAVFWERGIRNLLDMYPDAPILGLSATNIRYLDNQRDMADELFDGNIASEMTLGEAIVRGILVAPRYVISVYSYQKDLEKYKARIRRAKNKAVRDAAQKYLDALRRALEKADGLDVVFDKHLTDRTGKYIVFCSNIEHLNSMREESVKWFSRIDANPHMYTVYSSDPGASKAFQNFKDDNDTSHLRVLFAIDALNEGVHVDDISGVILLRPTISPIIYKQQIGRALSASKKKEPVIFDIVNNFENLYSIGAIEDEMKAAITYYRFLGQDREIVSERFKVIDEVRDCKRLFDELNDSLSASWDIMFAEAEKYYKTHGDLLVKLNYKTEDGYSLGSWLSTQRSIRRGMTTGYLSEGQIAKLDSIGMRWENYQDCVWNKNFDMLTTYYEEHGNIDVPASYVTEDGFKLGNWVISLRTYHNASVKNSVLTEERVQALEAMGMIWDKINYLWEKNYQTALDYFMEHHDLAIRKSYIAPNGIALGAWIYNIKTQYRVTKGLCLTNEQKERLEAIGVKLSLESPFDAQWNDNFLLAKQYYAEHGDLLVPYYYKTEDGFPLGLWISRHRVAAKKNAQTHIVLTEERRRRLDEIGMVWDYTPPKQWDFYYPILCRYYEQYGNINMTTKTYYEGVYPGQWLMEQKSSYRNGELAEDKIKLLDALHIDWRMRLDRLWEKAFAMAEACYRKNGSLVTSELNSATKSWLIGQRKKYRENNLTEEQISRLSAIGMVWELDDVWEEGFTEAEAYYREHGNLDIPVSCITKSGYKLGRWYRSCRNNYRDGNMSEDRKKRLEAIGMQWLSVKIRTWMQYYELAKQYRDKNGDLIINADYVTEDGTNLGVWISSQRYAYGKGKLKQDQIDLLNDIGMSWHRDVSRFEQGYQYAAAYKEQFEDLNVNIEYITDDGFKLGQWIAQQRTRRKAEKLSDERISRLNAIGMTWSAIDELWDKGFAVASGYYEEHGNLNITPSYICSDGFKLGAWVANKKNKYRSGKLSKERIKQLESLGIVWDALEDKWQTGYSYLFRFSNTYHHVKVAQGYKTDDGYSLGTWVSSQRKAYHDGYLTAEHIKKLNDLGFIWSVNKSAAKEQTKANNDKMQRNVV